MASGFENESEDYTDQDSDLDFDVDALEKRENQKKCVGRKESKTKIVPSEVDDKFFKLSEMESFLDDMDKREEKEDGDEEDVNYFQDLPSDDDNQNFDQIFAAKKQKKTTAKSSRNLKYKDYFDAVDSEPAEADAQSDVEDDDMGDDMAEEQETDEEDEEEEDLDVDEDTSWSKASGRRKRQNSAVLTSLLLPAAGPGQNSAQKCKRTALKEKEE
ncbi:unnamed protein product [Tetraodon nigroviridis]|uniref:(spotted green pufferfish) hypothetical protein n=1 Tax=Tetraodon nigroviridis TaxID=99883 RepID=Q4T4T4_TETNG|nr:unnamed protein product [Tetraodon nigroviridis]